MKNTQILQCIKAALYKDSQQAYDFLLRYYWKDIYNYIFSKVKNTNTAEDLTIETFTKVFRKLDLYSPDFDFKTWMISIAHNMVMDYFKKQRKSIIVIEQDEMPIVKDFEMSVEELVIKNQQKEHIRMFISKLKTNYRQVIELRYLKELSYNEISEELGVSLDNVKIRILRAKKILYDLIMKHK